MRLERALSASARRIEPLIGRLLRRERIRRVLHTRALRAWQATDAPLIVCYGNINRSAFAEHLARRRAGASPSSAGLYMKAGRPSPAQTVTTAAARGVDLASHRSAVLDGALVSAAPAIFIFDLDNLVRIALRHPAALRKTYFFGALAGAGNTLITDPHGWGTEALEHVFNVIEQALHWADRDRSRTD
jgi:protein-tyrosine-phosphatase